MLDDYESQLVFFSKGWFEYEDRDEALLAIRGKYYVVGDIENNKMRYLHDITYHIYNLCYTKLYSSTFGKEMIQREFFDEIVGNRFEMYFDVPDWKNINSNVDAKKMIINRILNRLLSILSTIQILETDQEGDMYELIRLKPIDYSVLPRRKDITDESQEKLLGY